jgi:hypothetical protein
VTELERADALVERLRGELAGWASPSRQRRVLREPIAAEERVARRRGVNEWGDLPEPRERLGGATRRAEAPAGPPLRRPPAPTRLVRNIIRRLRKGERAVNPAAGVPGGEPRARRRRKRPREQRLRGARGRGAGFP